VSVVADVPGPEVGATAPDEVAVAARAAHGKGATEVVVLDVSAVSGLTSYFVICSAGNDRLVRAIAESVEAEVKAVAGERPIGIEGLDSLDWVLMNFGHFIVHVFRQEAREFYDLERLWRDAPACGWDSPSGTVVPED
jgi:ribosome-associated protein